MSKNILLTGHTKGIGKAIITTLLQQDCAITGIARTELNINDITSQNKESFKKLHQLQFDLSNASSLQKACTEIKKHSFDTIVLNAGYNDIRPAESYTVQEIMEIITINFTAHAALIKTCLPSLIANIGHIIAIGSFSGIEVGRWNNYYGAAKAGLHHLMKNLFEQYRKQGLQCTTIIPDITNSEFYNHQKFEPADDVDTFINPVDIARIVEGILFGENNYVTTEIVVRPQRFELKRK